MRSSPILIAAAALLLLSAGEGRSATVSQQTVDNACTPAGPGGKGKETRADGSTGCTRCSTTANRCVDYSCKDNKCSSIVMDKKASRSRMARDKANVSTAPATMTKPAKGY
jgi:hypothetical protein